MDVVNIAAYKFVEIPDPVAWRSHLLGRTTELGLLGTILLATEGINLSMAGSRASIDAFLHFLRNDDRFGNRFSDIVVKESLSEDQPFGRMLVRLKKEIVTMRHPMICKDGTRAPAVEPETLKRWLDQGHDDNGREIVLLDTRNDYEVGIGTFEGALDLQIGYFGDFPEAVLKSTDASKENLEHKTIVSFCTGGIRCEKAALYMLESGFENVYQLDGGILRYLQEVGSAHWRGECFVFDRRVALDPQLKATEKQYEVTGAPPREQTSSGNV